MAARKRNGISRNCSGHTRQIQPHTMKPTETQGKGSVLATKPVETRGKGSVLVTKAVTTQGKGIVLATTNTADTQGKGRVLATKAAAECLHRVRAPAPYHPPSHVPRPTGRWRRARSPRIPSGGARVWPPGRPPTLDRPSIPRRGIPGRTFSTRMGRLRQACRQE